MWESPAPQGAGDILHLIKFINNNNLSSVSLDTFRGQSRMSISELIISFPPAGRGGGMAMKRMVTFPRPNVAPGAPSCRTRGTLRWEPCPGTSSSCNILYSGFFNHFYFIALCLRWWDLPWWHQRLKSAFPVRLVIPGLNISGKKFQILLWKTQGNDFLPFSGFAEGMDLSLCSPCLSLQWNNHQRNYYLWEKDKTHSRQALSDVERKKNALIKLLSLSKAYSQIKHSKLFFFSYFPWFFCWMWDKLFLFSYPSPDRCSLSAIWDFFSLKKKKQQTDFSIPARFPELLPGWITCKFTGSNVFVLQNIDGKESAEQRLPLWS